MIISLVIQAINKAAGPLSAVNAQFKKIDDTVKATNKRFEHLNNIGNRLTTLGAGMTIAGGGLAYSLGLTDAVQQSREAEHSLRSLGNVGNLTDRQLKEMHSRILQTSRATNQYQQDIIAGMNILVAAGLDPRIATDFMPVVGKTATATGAIVDDVAKTAFSAYDNLKVPISQLRQVMDTLTQSGKEGRFELRDMATYFPMLTANAQSLGMKGVPAVAQLGAALQIAMKGASDPSQAATNFQNFLQKITSRETVQNFKKFGVDVKAEMEKALKSGADPIEHMMKVIKKVTGGDKFKLSQIFADMQVTQFITPMMQNMEEYRRIRDKTFKATGVVDKDFENMMKTNKEQIKQFKINLSTLAMPKINQFFSVLNSLLQKLNGNSTALKLVLGGVVALLIGGTTLAGLGLFLSSIANGIVAFQTLKTMIQGSTIATRVFGFALRSIPILAIAMLIIGAGYLIYKHWDKISTWLKNNWKSVLKVFLWVNPISAPFMLLQKLVKQVFGIDLFSAGRKILSTLVEGIKSFANKPVETLKGIVQKMRNLLPFSPAKEGPFRDLHKIKLVETIAAAIKPGPLVSAMRGAVSAAAGVSGPRPAFAGAGGVVLHYSPTIHLSGGSPAVKDDLMGVLRQHKDELLRLIEQAQAKKARVKF
jgi:TP901 family phage tail tape measure protein